MWFIYSLFKSNLYQVLLYSIPDREMQDKHYLNKR